jgi:adenylate kinase
MKMIVLGSPGAGKGIYSQEVCRRTNLVQISTGDLLRATNNQDIKNKMQKGEFISDEIITEIVKEKIKTKNDNFILDGVPRTLEQAKELDKIIKIDIVINYTTNRQILIDRMSGRIICKKCNAIFHIKNIIPKIEGICDFCSGELYQREDDKKEAAIKRLNDYEKNSAPLINYYKEKGILKTLEINKPFGNNKEEIMKQIFNTIPDLKTHLKN